MVGFDGLLSFLEAELFFVLCGGIEERLASNLDERPVARVIGSLAFF